MLQVAVVLDRQQHRAAVVYHQLASQISFLLKAFEEQLIRSAIQLPVDIACRFAHSILAMLRKFDRKTMKWTPMQADEETFHNLPCKEVQRLIFL